MMQLQLPGRNNKSFGSQKKLDLKIDMTPMVDLGFLLISFFVITTQLSEPKTMDLIVPTKGASTEVKISTALTFLPSVNNQLYYYYGDAEGAALEHGLRETTYDVTKLRKIISGRKSFLIGRGINPDELFVMIKPDKRCNYGNVVDLLDEMIINDVKRYALIDPEEADTELIKKFPHS